MIRIPFTKLSVSWHLPALLIVFMILAPSWQRGLLGGLAIIAAVWLVAAGGWGLILLFAEGKKRRPGESWRGLSVRVRNEPSTYSDSASSKSRFDHHMSYRYVMLDCGHVLFESFPEGPPQEGDRAWCWGHRKLGPAQAQTVLEVSIIPPQDKEQKVLM